MKKRAAGLSVLLGSSLSLMALSLEKTSAAAKAEIKQTNILKLKQKASTLKNEIQELRGKKITQEIRKEINTKQKELGNITKKIRSHRRKL